MWEPGKKEFRPQQQPPKEYGLLQLSQDSERWAMLRVKLPGIDGRVDGRVGQAQAVKLGSVSAGVVLDQDQADVGGRIGV